MKNKGFSLIELMVVIVIVSILATIAIPGYNEQVAKSRRADAMRMLGDLQLKQERWRSNHTKYLGTDSTTANKTQFGVNASTQLPAPPSGTPVYYTVAITTAESGTGYTLTATRSGVQADDRCGNFVLTVASGVATKSLASYTNSSNCNWP